MNTASGHPCNNDRAALVLLAALTGPATATPIHSPPATVAPQAPTDTSRAADAATTPAMQKDRLICCASFREYGRIEAKTLWNRARTRARSSDTPPPTRTFVARNDLTALAQEQATDARETFFRGRYNRSRARLPENIERWRSQPDIANPGPDLANFPNSAFTLPAGRAYIEMSPLTFYGTAAGQPVQYNAEYLLRYGLTDDIELRLFGNGPSWMGGARSSAGFAPIAFDTKIQLWTEKPDYYLPAAGFEAYLLTQWFGSAPFNAGTQPSFTFNFDQSLPFEIDFEYNLGATRVQASDGVNVWEFSFQWALQRDLFDEDFAVFIHGFYNAMSLPRLPNVTVPRSFYDDVKQNAVGAGFIWTANRRFALYGQVSAGTTKFTPSTISMLGFAVSF
ncbi:transporter family protein [Methylotetracoccus oryzae]|uniref:transporter n=1 Tax=Methylotetracoccus oryzae TaxID=1919059 RepID=UPI001913DDF0|nr:transporter [Methylotetracoccus oryzae]